MSFPIIHSQRLRQGLQQAAWGAIGLYLLAMPVASVAVTGWNGHDLARALQLPLGLLCAAAWAANPGTVSSDVAWWGGMALVLALLAVTVASVPGMAGRELALLAGVGAIVAASAASPPKVASWVPWAWVPVAAMGLYAAIVLIIAMAVVAVGQTPSRIDLFVGYVNHRFFSHVLTASIPLLLVVSQLPRATRRLRLAARVVLVLCSSLMFASAGRGTLLAIAGAAALVGLVVRGRAIPALRALGGATAAGALLFLVVFVVAPWAVQGEPTGMADYAPNRLTSDQARGYLWQVAQGQIQAAPWLGVGPMHYAHLPNAKAAHPHNLALQLAAEWGTPLAALVLGAAGWALWCVLRRLRTPGLDPQRAAIGVPLALGGVAVLLDAQVSGNLVMPVSQVWSAVLFGGLLAWWRSDARAAAARPVPVRWLAVLVLVSQAWLVATVAPEVPNLAERLQQLQEAFPTERLQPRFWSVGRF